jgi:hypothetical protein
MTPPIRSRHFLPVVRASRTDRGDRPCVSVAAECLVGLQRRLLSAGRTDVAVRVSPSLSLADHWRDPADQERFRVGAGLIATLGS